MAVGELFLAAFIAVLFEKLASAELIKLARSEGIYTRLNKWKDTLSQIQAVLADAGEKHLRDRSVKLWLNKLQHLAYDIDDLLDDLATEAMRRQVKQESYANTSTGKVFKIFPKFSNFTPRTLMYGRKMSSKLNELTTKLHDLVEEKNILGLNNNVERSNRISRRLEETSLVDVSRIVGREGDKDALLGRLLGDDSCSENFSIVSIIGLGGIGKTTLAQVLYNDEKVKNHFELMSWVCVSDEFDVFNISKAIFKDVGGADQMFENLNQLHVALIEKLSKKTFLLVLDDVWNEDYTKWELLQRPFVAGAPGSKIIVTTRKNTVASVMDSIKTYPLELLSNEGALSLFAQHALEKQNFDSHPTLKLLGEGVMKKCGGLPLALITIGRVLRRKPSYEEWEELLNSEIWNLHNEGKILPALRLSYYDLPPHLKQMFVYCCLFPKDYLFDKDELVLLWMAEGFLYETKGGKSMENLGRECFEELQSRSFFQHSSDDKSRYKMHDLINDLATSVAGEFFSTSDDKMNVEGRNEVLEKFRHFSFIRQRYGVYRKFKSLQRAVCLRTFLAMSTMIESRDIFCLSNKVLVELLPQLRVLRVLSLTNYSIKEVPQSIGYLKHIRYLNFSGTSITCLPKQIGGLYNLQSLLLSRCVFLSSLPDTCMHLKRLRHLDISNTRKLSKMPLGIGGLTSLQTLSKVIVGEANGFKISDLKGLLHLEGQLSIQGLQKVINAIHSKEANLLHKKGLCDLEMEWNDVFDASRNENIEYEVLEGLKPYHKLRKLKILFYMGIKFPSWVGDPSFVCLTELTLRGCKSCTCLPTLGHLRSLQKLFVESMSGLKRLGLELLGHTNSCDGIAFPSLEVLKFKDMQSWEIWSINGGDKDGVVGLYPCLREISIINCPKLDVVEIELISSLRVLHIHGCLVAVLRSMVGVSPSILRLTVANIEGLTHLQGDVLEHLGAVEYLCVKECDELRHLWGIKSEACEILVSLYDLELESCQNLVSFGEKEVNLGISLKSLRHVFIKNCPRLESYSCPNRIEKLVIDNCQLVTSFTFPTVDQLPFTLKFLKITSSHNLEASLLLNNFLSSLGSLHISSVPQVKSFPEGCLVHLTTLVIRFCDDIESIPEKGFGFFPLFCLRNLHMNECKNLKSFSHRHLQSLASLEELSISRCPSMDNSFPCGLWPPNLRGLSIGKLKKPMSDWGLQNFPTSLARLCIHGQNSGVVSFATDEDVRTSNNTTSLPLHLPQSLTSLQLAAFMDLESLRKGLQHLTCLEKLLIFSCPKLGDLPETLLPSLSSLLVEFSPKLQERCLSKKGNYWPVISGIPHLDLSDWKELRDLQDALLSLLSSLWVGSCLKLQERCRSKKGNYWPIISGIPNHDVPALNMVVLKLRYS
ncbi:hypothetical protein OSB04_023447 [Centaurea solstitialis]|uniref:Uncharacterized protein n=1 Tax=Centaurea solstitialis TaxID=347529 RepID=A0AA38W9F6_9ASTR|nr:hypothetical protein OSB04_023447 [Centaurea solstitialis]